MTLRAIAIVFLSAVVQLAAAQPYVSENGRFEVDEVMGCAPFSVNITVYNCSPSCDVDLDGDGPLPFVTVNSPHTYNTPGTYRMTVVDGTGTNNVDHITITVLENISPEFNLYTCGNNRVSVDITDTNYDEYVINFNDGSGLVIMPAGTAEHTYASAGGKSVTIRGRNTGAADNCSSTTKNITALASLPTPSLTRLEVLDDQSIQLDFNGQPNILYRLEIAANSGSNFQLYKTLYNVNSEVLTNLRPEDTYYCFRLGAYDPCNNTTAYSTIMCSANFDLEVANNVNNLTWATNSSGSTGIRLTRTSGGNTLNTIVTGSTSYSDTDIVCGTEYCYQFITTYPGGAQSVSLQKCGTAFSTDAPAPIFNTTAVVAEPGVNLHWQVVPGFNADEYFVNRLQNGTSTEIGRTTDLQFFDPDYLTENETCYEVGFRDVCGNMSSLGDPVCPIRLLAELTDDNTINLTWTTFGGWRDGVARYTLEKYDLDGQLLEAIDMGLELAYSDESQDLAHQGYVYLVKASSVEPALPQALSNKVAIIKDPNIFYPTGFTPNGDNLNDLFNVYGQYIVGFEMNIFNRWGELLFTTTNIEQGWDGTFKGNPMPEGTYTFVADITDLAGRAFKKSGSVLLIRKGK